MKAKAGLLVASNGAIWALSWVVASSGIIWVLLLCLGFLFFFCSFFGSLSVSSSVSIAEESDEELSDSGERTPHSSDVLSGTPRLASHTVSLSLRLAFSLVRISFIPTKDLISDLAASRSSLICLTKEMSVFVSLS